MKKKTSMLLVLAMASTMSMALVGCGNDKGKTPETPDVPETPVVDQQNPGTETPEVETPEVETPEVKEVAMEDVVNTLKNTFGDYYLPNQLLDQESFNLLVGLTSDMYDEFYADMPMIGAHADRLFIVKTQKVDEVKAVFEAYKQSLIDDTMQYPMNVSKIAHSDIYVNGDFVMFFMLGGYTDEMPEGVDTMSPEDAEKATEEFQTNFYIAQQMKAIEALDNFFEDGVVPEAPVAEEVAEEVTDETTEDVADETTEAVEDVNTEDAVVDAVDETSTEVDGTVSETEPAEGSEENTTEDVSDVEAPADEVAVNN